MIIFVINHLVCKMSKNGMNRSTDIGPSETSFVCLFCLTNSPNPTDTQFTMI